MSEIVKVCKKHGELRKAQTWIKNYYKNGSIKRYLLCKVCLCEQSSARYIKHKEDFKRRSMEYYKKTLKKNPDKYKEYRRSYYKKNRDKMIARQKVNYQNLKDYHYNYGKNQRLELHDSYVKEVLIKHTNLKYKDIPEKLIECKREILLLKRQAREYNESH